MGWPSPRWAVVAEATVASAEARLARIEEEARRFRGDMGEI